MAAANDNYVRVRHACGTANLVDINQALTGEQLEHLETTPFHWVSKLSKEVEISSVLLGELVIRWDEGCRGFNVRGTVIPFTPADVCLALGLPATSQTVVGVESDQCYTLSLFGGAEVSIEDCLNKMLEVQDNVGDICRGYILLAFGEFYFPRTGRWVFTDYARLLDDLDATHSFNWARAMYDYLVDSLSRAAGAIHDGTTEHQTHLCGCAAILQMWAMNHVSIEQLEHLETTPFHV